MWNYEKKLQYPVKIKNPNPALEELKYKFIIKCGGKRLYEDIDIPMKPAIEEIKKTEDRNTMARSLAEMLRSK